MNNKTLTIGAIVILSLLLGIGVYAWEKSSKTENSYVRPNLSEQEKGNYDIQIKEAENALKAGGSSEEQYQNLLKAGVAQMGLGDYKEAKVSVQKAIALQPKIPGPYSLLFSIEVLMGDYKAAQDTIKKALDVTPTDPQLWRTYVDFQKNQLNASESEINATYQEALKQTGESIDIVTVYAQFLENRGDLEGSRDTWKKAVGKYPNESIYKQELARLEEKVKAASRP